MAHQEEFGFSAEWAAAMDERDPLSIWRTRFHFPLHNGEPCIYLTGNSLGLQPTSTRAWVDHELDAWAKFGVEGHFKGHHPWVSYHEILTEGAARLVGAKPIEVVMMNQLTSNLHFLLVSFYRPAGKRIRILTEAKAFPSDQYALDAQARLHGFDPQEVIIELEPRAGEHALRVEDVLSAIQEHKETLALVFFGGVNYYSGEVMPMKAIAAAANEIGAQVGFNLAHAAGNIPLQLHDWNVDFAVWCSYKYLNSGPGGVAGAFVHERHARRFDLPRLSGWWGHDKETRFQMDRRFIPLPGAEGWQVSNAPVLSMAAHKASLEYFDQVGMDSLRRKSLLLTPYLRFVLERFTDKFGFTIITPSNPEQHGCQISVLAHRNGRALFEWLTQHGVITDWREPNVIRMAPVPFYNSFTDVYRLGELLDGFSS
jgi:kynureninase